MRKQGRGRCGKAESCNGRAEAVGLQKRWKEEQRGKTESYSSVHWVGSRVQGKGERLLGRMGKGKGKAAGEGDWGEMRSSLCSLIHPQARSVCPCCKITSFYCDGPSDAIKGKRTIAELERLIKVLKNISTLFFSDKNCQHSLYY